jgi:serine/threonine-protein phosphatase PGAM5
LIVLKLFLSGKWDPPSYIFYQDSCRIEAAFRKFIHRAIESREGVEIDGIVHTADVIVCHGNVIRYFFARSLQLPPKIWLHFNFYHASLCRISINQKGYVSVHFAGDIGALPTESHSY